MHVVFLEIDHERDWAVASIGPAFLASFLRSRGHEASLIRVPLDSDPDDVIAQVTAASPCLVGLSLTTRQWLRGREIVARLRERIDVPVVAGGLHPTFSAEEVLSSPGFDYVCVGEGEEPLLELVNALERDGSVTDPIANIWVRGGACPPRRTPFEPLDDLPFMARDLLDEKYGVVHMCTQRGCPFPCTYCAARMYNQLYEESGADYGRRRSHANVLDELRAVRRDDELNYVIFLDDTFTINRPWVREFCRVYGEELAVPFSLHARVETVNAEMLQLLAGAGCRHITYGVESGSLRVRREIMKRPVKNDRFRNVFRWTREAGILVTANYMLGLPGEKPEDIEMTLALHEELQPDDFGYFVFYPYPGTEMFHVCRDKGYLPENYLDLPANHRTSILTLPDLTQDDIDRYYDLFTQARERSLRARYGGALTDDSEAEAMSDIRHSAAIG